MKKRELYWSILAILVSYLLLIFLSPSTGDEGDSIQHYLISRFSWAHPRLFFDHWGKPLFTILSSPFSQFGFKGIQIFNLLNLIGTVAAIYLIADKLHLKNPLIPSVLFPFIPIVLLTTPTGLTEPLFAHISAWTFYLLLKRQWILAATLASLLPFVRSEGLVILFVIFTYLATVRQLPAILMLFAGHLIMGLAGMKYYSGDFLWPVTKIPYPADGNFYGKGPWNHFILNLPRTTGIAGTILLVTGIIFSSFRFRDNTNNQDLTNQWVLLISGSLVAIYAFHSFAWATGRFNSFGLLRVMTAVMPQAALLMALGVEAILSKFNITWLTQYRIPWILAAFFLLIDLSLSPRNRLKLLEKNSIQMSVDKAIDLLDSLKVPYRQNLSLQGCPYAYLKMEKDPFGPLAEPIHAVMEKNRIFPQGTVLLWDEYYSGFHYKIPKDSILKDARFEMITSFITTSSKEGGGGKEMIILRVRDEFATNYSSDSTNRLLESIVGQIKGDEAWMKKIKDQAEYNNISPDSCVRLNARYMIERQ